MAGVYLHIPYCKRACTYCDFFFSTSLRTMPALVSAIGSEIAQRRNYLPSGGLSSLYFGGGTPSMLNAAQLASIFDSLQHHYSWDRNSEVTLEANPDDITPGLVKEWIAAGINRLSIGLQSFNEEELRWMNRAHTAAQSVDAVMIAQDAGISNISIDLIYGSRFQDARTWERTLKKVTELGVPHISAYNLTIEKRTKLGHALQKGLEPAVDDELSGKQFLFMSEFLQANGFMHYEISNFAKPGCEAVHNSSYWKQQPYLGLGPSAHSFDGRSRQWNVSNIPLYIKSVESGQVQFEKEVLSAKDLYNEYVLTRMRTSWGCDEREIAERFGNDVLGHFLHLVQEHSGDFERIGTCHVLSKHARLRADGIASDFFLV